MIDDGSEQRASRTAASQLRRDRRLGELIGTGAVGHQGNASDRPAVKLGDQDLTAGFNVSRDGVIELPAVLVLDDEVSRDPFLIEDAKRVGILGALQRADDEIHPICVGIQHQDVQYLVHLRQDAGDMNVELRHLRYFVAVAEELHFGRAAVRLDMAQPPLSQAIRQLEDAVGCLLLARTSRSVALTPAGSAFLERARRTLRNVDEDIREARSIGEGQTGRLNVGFVGSGMLTTLPRILSRYVTAYPNVQLQLHESFTAHVIDGLLAGDVDAGIVRDAEPVDGLIATPILSEPFSRCSRLPIQAPKARRCQSRASLTPRSSTHPAAPVPGRSRSR